jgi:esterase/lipase superfamily enzyme
MQIKLFTCLAALLSARTAADAPQRITQSRTLSAEHAREGIFPFYEAAKGNANDYSYDTNNAAQSVAFLKTFLADLAARGSFDSITLVAHGIGNRALTRAFMELASDLPNEQLALFKELILAAPDIDGDVFGNDIAPALAAAGSPVTLYASANDLAMVASRELGGAPRAGDTRQGVVVGLRVAPVSSSR